MTIKTSLLRWLRTGRQWVDPPARQLAAERLLAAYRQGRFPLFDRQGLLVWHCPPQRALIPLDERFRIGKRLQRHLDRETYRVTFDQAFEGVIRACAEPRGPTAPVWITPEMVRAYLALFRLGHAHSVEVWAGSELVGGEYGVAIGGFYSGESMFTRADYAGRVALVHLVNRLRRQGFTLLDTQYLNPTAREFGAFELPRDDYLRQLAQAVDRPVRFA
jgi:leucyl/phenylalanyl-tRNA--protein transferase